MNPNSRALSMIILKLKLKFIETEWIYTYL